LLAIVIVVVVIVVVLVIEIVVIADPHRCAIAIADAIAIAAPDWRIARSAMATALLFLRGWAMNTQVEYLPYRPGFKQHRGLSNRH
jgi:hypothetical protein